MWIVLTQHTECSFHDAFESTVWHFDSYDDAIQSAVEDLLKPYAEDENPRDGSDIMIHDVGGCGEILMVYIMGVENTTRIIVKAPVSPPQHIFGLVNGKQIVMEHYTDRTYGLKGEFGTGQDAMEYIAMLENRMDKR